MEDTLSGADREALEAEILRLRGEITEMGASLKELDRVAHMDPLVPVANRRGLIRQLEIAIARHVRQDVPSALLFVDVDGLKVLNDEHGHAAGDAALICLAQLMVRNVRKTDLVARIGGDEFAILLDGVQEKQALETARRIEHAVDICEFSFEGQNLPLGIAIGLTLVAGDDDPEAVLDRADREMYRDKADSADVRGGAKR
jgi:diguanylate cyclase (GGDEF)-like protein